MVAIVRIKSSEIPKAAIDSTETLMKEAELADKIDDMSTEEESDMMKIIGDIVKQAKTLPAT